MAKHRTHSLEFKRQVAQEFLAGETLHSLAKRYDLSRNLIRIWVQRFEAGALDEDAVAADLIEQYEARIAAVEPQRATTRSTTRADIRDSGVQDGHGPDARGGSAEKAVPAGSGAAASGRKAGWADGSCARRSSSPRWAFLAGLRRGRTARAISVSPTTSRIRPATASRRISSIASS